MPFILFLPLFLIFLSPLEVHPRSDKLTKAGWIETAQIYPGNLTFKAKLDTGAYSASLHADDIMQFERDGESWVSFKIQDDSGKKLTLEKPIHRIVKIKRHKQESSKRPVVKFGICIGEVFQETEVNLADRSKYKYDLLIGRLFLDEHFTVDPSSKHLLQPNCKALFPK